MRVISGDFGGRRLKPVPGMKTRPTTDKIKENIFNIVGPYFDGGSVLDMYAGSGGLAIEAVSRGMDDATLIDKQFAAIKTINENVEITKSADRFNVIKGDSKKVILNLASQGKKFAMAFFDPPYALQTIEKDISTLLELDLLTDNVMIICETSDEVELPEQIGRLQKHREQHYGITKIVIYKGV
jgi:16S rRNA (guanine966-N2)-methyltransferase